MQQLKAALEARDQAYSQMTALEQAHAQGRIDPARYQEQRAQFVLRLNDVASELQRARTRVQAQLVAVQARGREAERKSRDLDVRVLIGEFDASAAEARRHELATEVVRATEEAARLSAALATDNPAEIALPDAPTAHATCEADAPYWAEEVADRLLRVPTPAWMTRHIGNAVTLGGAGLVIACTVLLPYWWAILVVATPHYRLAQDAPVLGIPMLMLAAGAATALGMTQYRTRAAVQALLALGILCVWVLTLFDLGTPSVLDMLQGAQAAAGAAGSSGVPFIEAQSGSHTMAASLKALLLHKAPGCFILPLGAFAILVGAAAQVRNRRASGE